jgi:hypothetical protein
MCDCALNACCRRFLDVVSVTYIVVSRVCCVFVFVFVWVIVVMVDALLYCRPEI